jgi:transcription elongation factor/antiterminator RfaH
LGFGGNLALSNTDERLWYTVYTKPQKEDVAQCHLAQKGLEVFLPKLMLPSDRTARRRVVPLFPNYLFARINAQSEQYGYVAWSPGVKRIVSFNGTPAPIESKIVEFLKSQTGDAGFIPARSNLKVGQEVRISGGPFDSLVGMIQEPPNAKGRVRVLVNLLNQQTRVEIPTRYLNAGWIACSAEYTA